jgi:glutaredoxin 3
MRDVIVYTTEACSYCTRVKMLLRSQDIDFEEVNLAGDAERIVALSEQTGMMTLPQVTVGGILVGGYDETARAASSGMLADLLAD